MRRMTALAALGLGVLILGGGGGTALATELTTPRARVEHHLRHVAELTRHFEAVLAGDCPHFTRPQEWSAYLDEEIDRLVLLLAHREEAWAQAKLSGDDELRRVAKTPREQRDRALVLVEKFQACAGDNGARLPATGLWRRIEREVERRREEIATPQ